MVQSNISAYSNGTYTESVCCTIIVNEFNHQEKDKITNIKGLSTLTNLRRLNILNNQITDISPVKELPNLTTLSLEGNPLPDYVYKEAMYKRFILSVLNPYIYEAISKYYGESRQFMDSGILDIKATQGGYKIKVRVKTFVGSHNPPYGLDTMAIVKDNSGIHIQDFQHEEIE